MNTIIKSVNGVKYTFKNHAKANRASFSHHCELYRDGKLIQRSSATYYNRSWESYTYQSVMKKAVDEAVERYTDQINELLTLKNLL